jgi:hypothetical protein
MLRDSITPCRSNPCNSSAVHQKVCLESTDVLELLATTSASSTCVAVVDSSLTLAANTC